MPFELGAAAMGQSFAEHVKQDLKFAYKDWKAKKEINPEQIKRIANEMDNVIKKNA